MASVIAYIYVGFQFWSTLFFINTDRKKLSSLIYYQHIQYSTNFMSHMARENDRGPKTESCGTLLNLLKIFLILCNFCLFTKFMIIILKNMLPFLEFFTRKILNSATLFFLFLLNFIYLSLG